MRAWESEIHWRPDSRDALYPRGVVHISTAEWKRSALFYFPWLRDNSKFSWHTFPPSIFGPVKLSKRPTRTWNRVKNKSKLVLSHFGQHTTKRSGQISNTTQSENLARIISRKETFCFHEQFTPHTEVTVSNNKLYNSNARDIKIQESKRYWHTCNPICI